MNFLSVLVLTLSSTLFSIADVVDDILVDLANEDYATRSSAHGKLNQWATEHKLSGMKILEANLKTTKSPEIKARLKEIIKNVKNKYLKLGAMGAKFDEAPNGVMIQRTFVGLAAHAAGLKEGDVIERMNDDDLAKTSKHSADILHHFNTRMLDSYMGETLNLKVRRGKELIDVQITLSSYEEQKKLTSPVKLEQKSKRKVKLLLHEDFNQPLKPHKLEFKLGK